MIGLKWTEADIDASCLRLEDSKEGESIRPVGLPVVEYLERRRTVDVGTYVFPGSVRTTLSAASRAIGNISSRIPRSDVTPHVLRHTCASIANDRFYRGDHRDARGSCQGFGDEQVHPYARHRAHHGCGYDLGLHSRPPGRHRVSLRRYAFAVWTGRRWDQLCEIFDRAPE